MDNPIIKIGFATSGFGSGELDFIIDTKKLCNLSPEDFDLIKRLLTEAIPNSVSFGWAEEKIGVKIMSVKEMFSELSGVQNLPDYPVTIENQPTECLSLPPADVLELKEALGLALLVTSLFGKLNPDFENIETLKNQFKSAKEILNANIT